MTTTTPPAGGEHAPAWLDRQAAIAGRLLVLGLAIAAAIWLALQVRVISMAVVLGFAEVSLLWPAVKWLRARRVPQAIAAILCVVGFLALFVGLLAFVVSEVVRSSPRLADAVSGAFGDILEWIRSGQPFEIGIACRIGNKWIQAVGAFPVVQHAVAVGILRGRTRQPKPSQE